MFESLLTSRSQLQVIKENNDRKSTLQIRFCMQKARSQLLKPELRYDTKKATQTYNVCKWHTEFARRLIEATSPTYSMVRSSEISTRYEKKCTTKRYTSLFHFHQRQGQKLSINSPQELYLTYLLDILLVNNFI